MKSFPPIVFGAAVALFAAGCAGPGAIVPALSESSTGVLLARVVAISAVPDPADAPYEDCLTHVKLQAVNSAEGFEAGDSLVIVAWGFRDRKLAEAAVLEPGDTIVIEPVTFESVEETHRHTMRVDDTGDFESPLFWAETIGFVDSDTQQRVQGRIGKFKTDLNPYGMGLAARERVLGVMKALGGEPAGLFYGDFGFIYYEYLYADRYSAFQDGGGDTFGVSPIDAILDFKRFLDSRGIELVVIFPPRSAAIFPDFLTGVAWDHEVNGRIDLTFAAFVESLRGEGVEVVDVVPDFIADRYETGPDGVQYPVYLRSEPHWSSGGARRAARLVAEAIKQHEWFDREKRGSDRKPFQFEPQVELGTLKNGYAVLGGRDEQFGVLLHRVVPEPGFESYADPSDLSAPVQLIGDSFAWHEVDRQASFYDHLVAELGLPVGMTAIAGSATTTALDQWIRRGDMEATRVVIWEIVASTLVYPHLWRRLGSSKQPVLDLVRAYKPSLSSGSPLAVVRDDRSIPLGLHGRFVSRPRMSLMAQSEAGRGPPPVQRSSWSRVALGPAGRFRCKIKDQPMNFNLSGSVAYQVLIDGAVIAQRGLQAEGRVALFFNKPDPEALRTRLIEVFRSHAGRPFGGVGQNFLFRDYAYLYEDDWWIESGPGERGTAVSPLDSILGFKRELAEQGIDLIVLFPPTTATVFPDYGANEKWDFEQTGRVDVRLVEFFDRLRRAGVTVADPFDDFIAGRFETGPDGRPYPIFDVHDVHWSPLGAQLSARRVAAEIKSAPWYAQGLGRPADPDVVFEQKTEVVRVRDFNLSTPDNPITIDVVAHRTVRTPANAWVFEADSPDAVVHLIGDSFLQYHQKIESSFAEHLAAELKMPVRVFSVPGHATTTAVSEWSRTAELQNVKAVV